MAARGVRAADAGDPGGAVGGGSVHPGVVHHRGALSLLADIPHELGLGASHCDDAKWNCCIEHIFP